MLWLVIGLVLWAGIFLFAVACGRAAAKPWPKRIEDKRDDDGDGYCTFCNDWKCQ